MSGGKHKDPAYLAFDHRYEEALDAYDRLLKRRTPEAPFVATRATILLCLKRYDEALRGFELANDLIRAESRGESSSYDKDIAVVQWLLGNRAKAIEVLRGHIEGLARGTILYADAAGGVGPGLLLWFAAEKTEDDVLRQCALAHIARLTESAGFKPWLATLGLFALGKVELTDVLISVAGTPEMVEARKRAKKGILVRRRLCRSVFYDGVKRLQTGDTQGYLQGMADCCSIDNPVMELEWYLARSEAGL